MEFNHEVISQKYGELGYECGWTFLACREERLLDADVAFVGLNPAGPIGHRYQEIWSCESNAFCNEPSKIQKQVTRWHDALGLDYERTLCAQFVPFRSSEWRTLKNKKEAVPFSRALWNWVLRVAPAKLFITMGGTVAWHLVDLLEATPSHQELPTGTSGRTINAWKSPSGKRVISVPHPSRNPLFGQSEVKSEVARTMLNLAAELRD